MKTETRHLIRKFCVFGGIGLLIAAVVVLVFWQGNIHLSEKRSESYVTTLRTLMPEPQGAVPEPRRDNTMPILSLDGTDFAGILEMPRYDSSLPVGAKWGKSSKYPCCFSGSIYDGSLQIGATSQGGQFDFYREISVGDAVYFTDMEGNRYAFAVTDLRYEKHADQTALQKNDAALTIFVKNIYSFEYIIIFCDIPS